MSQRSIQQQRAAYALNKVLEVKQATPAIQKRFKAYSNTLPAMIQMNGLGQALAFAYQKSNGKKEEEKQGWTFLFNAVNHWLCKERGIWPNDQGHLLKNITEGTQEEYQLAQAEAQALLSWIKDFARAEIAGDAEGD